MILDNVKQEVLREGVVSDSGFSIKATVASFEILSSGLYTNKILAVIRELACNAYDSHVAAGKKEVPIKIKLPTNNDLQFKVTDNGIGLSHEQVINNYSTYFDSTKQNSNDYIGALGLGSKSPFSYVSSFIVESIFDGVHRIYSCYKNEEGLPYISLLSEQETSEENGLSVSISVYASDVSKFSENAKNALRYFDPYPEIEGPKNFSPFKETYVMKGETWGIREVSGYYRGYGSQPPKCQVIQGLVSYPIDLTILSQHGLGDLGKALISNNLDIILPIGSVDVAASREALSYTKRTITNLINSIEQISQELKESFKQEIDSKKTYWEALTFCSGLSQGYNNDLGSFYSVLNNVSKFTYKGKEIIKEIFFFKSNLDLENVTITKYHLSNSRRKIISSWKFYGTPDFYKEEDKKHYENYFKISIAANRKIQFILDQEPRSNVELYTRYLKDTSGVETIFVIRPIKKKIDITKQVASLQEFLGSPEFLDLHSLGYSPSPKIKWRNTGLVNVWGGFRSLSYYQRKFEKDCWNKESVNFDDGGIYVEVDRFSIFNSKSKNPLVSQLFIDKYIKIAEYLRIINPGQKIYGFNKLQVAKYSKNKKWRNFFDVCSDETLFDKNYENWLICTTVSENIYKVNHKLNDLVIKFSESDINFAHLAITSEFRILIDKINLIKGGFDGNVKRFVDDFEHCEVFGNVRNKVEDNLKDIEMLWKNVYNKYPLLKSLTFDSYFSVKDFTNYVELVDNSICIDNEV